MAKKVEKKKSLVKVKEPTKTHVDEKGSPFYLENRIDISELGEKSWIKWVYKAIDYFKQGIPREVIVQNLKEESKISEDSIRSSILSKASQIISEEFEKNDEYVLGLHLERYQKEIKNLYLKIPKLEKRKDLGDWKKQEMINSCYFEILDIMFHKERLLQLHNKKVVVRINQINNTIIRERKNKWNLSNLTLSERVDFLNLVQKSKKNQFELHGVTQNVEESVDTQVIEDAIIVEENPLEKIKQVTVLPEQEIIPGVALLDTFEKLKKAFEEKARLEFEKAGTKITNDKTGEGKL